MIMTLCNLYVVLSNFAYLVAKVIAENGILFRKEREFIVAWTEMVRVGSDVVYVIADGIKSVGGRMILTIYLVYAVIVTIPLVLATYIATDVIANIWGFVRVIRGCLIKKKEEKES